MTEGGLVSTPQAEEETRAYEKQQGVREQSEMWAKPQGAAESISYTSTRHQETQRARRGLLWVQKTTAAARQAGPGLKWLQKGP